MTNWTTEICHANGIDIHYLRTGGDKPSIVLLHGLMLSGACWTPLARTLEKNYDVIMPDARGHGYSSAPDHGYSYHNLANDVVSFIDKLGLDNPLLLGHSMGGMTATVVAMLQPQLLRGLILADPSFLTPQHQREINKSDLIEQHQKILARSREDYLTEMQIRHKRRTQEIVELFVHARFQTSVNAFEILTPPNPDYKQMISNLNVTSLLVIGDVGSVVSKSMAIELTELNQHLQAVQIAEAGHAVPYDQPECFSAIVQTFLHAVSK